MKHLNIRSSYSIYSSLSNNPEDVNTFMEVVKGYMKFLSSKLHEVGEISIPEKLGTVQIVGKKAKVTIENGEIKGLAPDWASTKALWDSDEEAKNNKQLVYHFNEETNGVRYRFFWSKSRVLVANKTLYNLRMTRTNKRTLSSNIKAGKEYLIK